MQLGQPRSLPGNRWPEVLAAWNRARERDLLRSVRAYRGGRPPCPHCKTSRTHRWGQFQDRQRWKCTGCLRTFSDLTGTFLARTRKLAQWIAFADHLRETPTVRQAAARVGINKDTALRWRHRLIDAAHDALGPLVQPAPKEAPFLLVTAQPFPFDPGIRPDLASRKGRPVTWVFLAATGAERHVPAIVRPMTTGQVEAGQGRLSMAEAFVEELERLPPELGALTAHRPEGLIVHQYCFPRERPFLHRLRWKEHTAELLGRHRFLRWWMRRFIRWTRRFHGIARRNLGRYMAWFRLLEMERTIKAHGSAAPEVRLRPLGRSRFGTLLACVRGAPPAFREP